MLINYFTLLKYKLGLAIEHSFRTYGLSYNTGQLIAMKGVWQ